MEEELLALLSGIAGGLVYWGRRPQSVTGTPYVVLQRISQPRDYHMQGQSSLVETRVQVDAYGRTFTEASTTAKEVIATASGHRQGAFGGIFVARMQDLPATEADDSEELFRTSLDLIIHYKEN